MPERPATPPPTQPLGGLVWEDPPPKGAHANRITHVMALREVAPQLRRNPDKWLRFKTFTGPSAAGVARKALIDSGEFPDLEFQATSGKGLAVLNLGADVKSVLYVRYVEGD